MPNKHVTEKTKKALHVLPTKSKPWWQMLVVESKQSEVNVIDEEKMETESYLHILTLEYFNIL